MTANPILDLFGAEPRLDPRLEKALSDLAGAVCDLRLRSKGFRVEPNLSDLSWAVREVLEASGLASLEADHWVDFEQDGRLKSKREEAWSRCDALFRMDLRAATEGWDSLKPDDQVGSLPLSRKT
jgi:hypothetical protein